MGPSAEHGDIRAQPREELVVLHDGTEIMVRAVRPEDKALLAEGFARLTPAARRARFFVPLGELDPETLAYLTEVDHVDHEAIGALGPHGEPVGIARYVRRSDEPEVAEAAVVVLDDWQRRGVATELLSRLARRALENGIERFAATVLPDNDEVIALINRFGHVRRVDGESRLVELEVDLAGVLSGDGMIREILRQIGVLRVRAMRQADEPAVRGGADGVQPG